jgi:hypothetical protein
VKKPSAPAEAASDDGRPGWFEAFLADRGTRKPSAHTMKAYRQDFDAIATLIVGDQEPLGATPEPLPAWDIGAHTREAPTD